MTPAARIDRRTAFGAVRDHWQTLPPPVYGEHDCVLWAAAVFDALTGRDALGELGIAAWSDLSAAVQEIRRFSGGRTLDAAVEAAATGLGLQRVYKLMAQTGDLALLSFSLGDKGALLAPGIIDDGQRGAALTRLHGVEGLVSVPMAAVVRTWRV